MPLGYPPTVFVSSTCYDLGQVRADLKEYLDSGGFDALFSETPAFPVNASVGTVENCVQVVRERADLFVLVVGARYGSVTSTGQSVTNLEYLAAKAKGIPIFIFVSSQIQATLPVWKQNPQGNFQGIVDSPKLFDFVDSISNSRDHWVFGFTDAKSITNVLKHQFAYLFMDSLVLRSKFAAAKVPPSLAHLSNEALSALVEKGDGWEFRLFATALQDELDKLRGLKRDLQYSLAIGPVFLLQDDYSAFEWSQQKMSDASNLASVLSTLLNSAAKDAIGVSGVAGNAEHIVYVAHRIGACYQQAIDSALEFYRVEPPDDFSELFDIVEKFYLEILQKVEGMPAKVLDELSKALEAENEGRKYVMNLMMELENPMTGDVAASFKNLVNKIFARNGKSPPA